MLEYEEEIRKKLNQINKEDTTQVVDEKASSSTLEEDFNRYVVYLKNKERCGR